MRAFGWSPLGTKEMGTIYSKDQLKNLLQIYAQSAGMAVQILRRLILIRMIRFYV
jgi:hypothetical protein